MYLMKAITIFFQIYENFSLDDGRVVLSISGNRCEATVKTALNKDHGTWNLVVGTGKLLADSVRKERIFSVHVHGKSKKNKPKD